MPVVENTVRIEAPVEAVWDVLGPRFGELTRWAKVPGRSRLDHPGPVGVGTTRVIQVAPLLAVRETISAYEAPTHLGYEVHGLPPVFRDVRSDWRLEPDGAATIVRFVASSEAGLGPLGRLAIRLVDGRNRAMLAKMTRDLKRFVEAGR